MTTELARKLEQTEAAAWQDMVIGANTDFKKKVSLDIATLGDDTCILCPGIPFVHFNCLLGFGTSVPVTNNYLDSITEFAKNRNLPVFYLYYIKELDTNAESLLAAAGFVPSGSWERTYRDGQPLDPAIKSLKPGWRIVKVDDSTATAWAEFVSGTYQMPATKSWLLDLALRDGWHHYMLMQDDAILAVRSIYVGKNKIAFWGVEAPIPGLMTADFSMDFALAHHIVKEGLQMGVKGFVGDIEMVNDKEDTPAYKNFRSLGFSIPYRRYIYKLKS